MKYCEGKNGWLFLNDDTNAVMRQISGNYYEFTERDAERWRKVIEDRRKNIVAPYLFSVVPNKECVYSEHLPDNISLSENRPIYSVIAACGEQVIYPIQDLRDKRDWAEIYQRTDTHWNAQGAFIFAQALFRAARATGLNAPRPVGTDVTWKSLGNLAGDLGSKTSPHQRSPAWTASFKGPDVSLVFDNGIRNRGCVRIFEGSSASGLKIMMFCDSFGFTHLAPILANYAGLVICIRSGSIDPEMIDRVKPDLVISQYVERFLVHPHPAFQSLPEIIRAKIEAGAMSAEEAAAFSASGSDAYDLLTREQFEGLRRWLR